MVTSDRIPVLLSLLSFLMGMDTVLDDIQLILYPMFRKQNLYILSKEMRVVNLQLVRHLRNIR